MVIFGPKQWVNHFRKMSIFDSFNFLFLSVERSFFVVKYRERHFPCLYRLKKQVKIMVIFGHKPWVNPFGKVSIFRILDFLFLKPTKAFLRFKISKKTFSWPILPKKKSLEKGPFLRKNHGLTPLEKCQFFDFFNFLFL